jgi:hypothetical protein
VGVFVLIAITITITITLMISIGNDTILAFASRSQSRYRGEETKLIGMVDNVRPSIKITNPSPQSTFPFKEITVNGTTFDSGSGVKLVEVFTHMYPFNNIFEYQEASPTSTNGDWSRWSISVPIDSVGVYRILVHVIDNAGNENWNETRFSVPFFADSTDASEEATTTTSLKKKIAIVVPTFTETAYSSNSFYSFYNKYYSIPPGKNVTTAVDLDMLSTPVLHAYINPYTAANLENLFTLDRPGAIDLDGFPINTLADHLRKQANSTVTVIRDEDIHNGYIFNPGVANDNGKNNLNVYDILILFHDEYATQAMYDNYRRFVSNGGTILFLDANDFIAEVDYDKDNLTIRLVKGHTWEFDGRAATRSVVAERWFDENKEWIGSNFLTGAITDKIYFKNNPFNYTHFEENYINNPRSKILIDYDAVVPKNSVYSGFHVASYELSYGKGKVIMTGLYGQKLISNKSFLKMLDSWILN